MDNFNLCMYTDIVFGKDAEKQVANKLKQYGATKVMLVYGGGSIKKYGLYDIVVDCMKDAGISFIELGGVEPNPRLDLALHGMEIAKKEGVDFLLALGGASSIDTAKAIALSIANPDVDVWQTYYVNAIAPEKMAPVGVIHTISAAGSETSRSSVLKDAEHNRKVGFLYTPCRPVFALMNPEWTYTLPAYQTAAGAVDIFSHAFERYFHPGESSIADGFGETLMKAVIEFAPIALKDPTNYQARAELMLAGSFAHNDISGVGHGDKSMDKSCHPLESPIGGLFDTTHGAGLGVIMPTWLEYTAKRDGCTKQVRFAVNVFGAEYHPDDPMKTVLEGVSKFRAWIKSLGMPNTLSEMGISGDDLEKLIKVASPAEGKPICFSHPLNAKDVENIYRMAK